MTDLPTAERTDRELGPRPFADVVDAAVATLLADGDFRRICSGARPEESVQRLLRRCSADPAAFDLLSGRDRTLVLFCAGVNALRDEEEPR